MASHAHPGIRLRTTSKNTEIPFWVCMDTAFTEASGEVSRPAAAVQGWGRGQQPHPCHVLSPPSTLTSQAPQSAAPGLSSGVSRLLIPRGHEARRCP